MIVRTVLSATLVFGLAVSISAGPKPSSVSASVRATATVVNPIGLTEPTFATNEGTDYNSLMVRFPSPDGIVLSVSINDEPTQTIHFDRSTSRAETFRLIGAPEIPAVMADSWTVVITLYSISQ